MAIKMSMLVLNSYRDLCRKRLEKPSNYAALILINKGNFFIFCDRL